MFDTYSSMFLLDPEITFLNHGSFGACPRPVFESYQSWQRRLERQPVEFLDRQVSQLMAESRSALAQFLNCGAEEIVYFPNPTTAINMVARNLELVPGDEILTSDHEYGAMDRTWRYVCQKVGARYVQQPIPLPVTTPEEFVETFWKGVTPKTKVIFLSHITSPTALIFPVDEICRRARQAGILCIVDGAHAPGQIPVDLGAIGADLYVGACHKWMMSPKGAAFLYANPKVHHWLDPLVISWGYQAEEGFGSSNQFIDYHEWQGTRDIAAFLSVPAAIEFMREHQWEAVTDRCHHLARHARREINTLTVLPPICPETSLWFKQMFAARLPEDVEEKELKRRLYDEYCIEVPLFRWQGEPFIRASIQGYNTQSDVDALIEALGELLQNPL
ncbi:MAG: aminotransferase class V-fold PLP-dependent enzyme [Anaerolineales bacterium]|nr:aminotransferase class V-fold PLP-dependent enzyme [Chloroflexota bacterium]MBL6981441.1 aminotransferase class V-fold PLP-dependent enzyme [Anaerolineales bacterium]